MRHELPQFINIEDKIFGPFTWRQFLYLGGGGALSYVMYEILPLMIAIPVILALVGFSGLLAFYKINNRPFIEIVQSAVLYALRGRFFLWKQKNSLEQKQDRGATEKPSEELGKPITESRLQNIAWSLDVLDMKDRNAGIKESNQK